MGVERKYSRRDFLRLNLSGEFEKRYSPETLRPNVAKGFYLTYETIPRHDQIDSFIDLVSLNRGNTVVVDIKNEAGRVHIPFSHPLKPNYQQSYPDSAESLYTFLEKADRNNIHVIGRVSVMKDTRFAYANPSLAIRNNQGSIWHDLNGNAWANPYMGEVADYNAQFAKAAADFGINQIQYDYIRFPSDDSDTGSLLFNNSHSFENRTSAIANILRVAKEKLPEDKLLTADIFGYAAWTHQGDLGIGQHIETMASYVDGFSPMAYPTLYGSGIPDCDCRLGVNHSYETVYYTVQNIKDRLDEIGSDVFVEPWVQAFPDYNYNAPMGSREFNLQKDGALDAGAAGVLAWDPTLEYDIASY